MSPETMRLIRHGTRFPYDAPDEWWKRSGDQGPDPIPAKDWAHVAARAILSSMTDRRGIKNGFDDIDEATRREIVETIAAIVRESREEIE